MPLALATVALVVTVLVVVVALIAAHLASGSAGTGPPPTPLAPASVVTAATAVPPAVLDAVGAPGPPDVEPPVTVSGTTTLRQGGRPEVVYVGAEFCPFCAAERWALVVALGRFGHFSRLGTATSSPDLVFARTSSLSFRGSTYTSRWLAFAPTETYSASGSEDSPSSFAPLQGLSPAVAALVRRTDVPPLAAADGTLPFVDVGGRTVVAGSAFSPAVLAGASLAAVAGDLSDPTSPVAQSVDGAANELTAALCAVTGDQPARVCQSEAAAAGAARLAPAPARSRDGPAG